MLVNKVIGHRGGGIQISFINIKSNKPLMGMFVNCKKNMVQCL